MLLVDADAKPHVTPAIVPIALPAYGIVLCGLTQLPTTEPPEPTELAGVPGAPNALKEAQSFASELLAMSAIRTH